MLLYLVLRSRQIHLRPLWGSPNSFQQTLNLTLTNEIELEIQEMGSDSTSQNFEGSSQNYTNLTLDSGSLILPPRRGHASALSLCGDCNQTDRLDARVGRRKLSTNICRKLSLRRLSISIFLTRRSGPLVYSWIGADDLGFPSCPAILC